MDIATYSNKKDQQTNKINHTKRIKHTPGKLKEFTRPYQKVNQDIKEQLFKLVNDEKKKVIQAARQLQLNYSTAKTILFTKRKAKRQCGFTQLRMYCKFRIITQIQEQVVSIYEYQINIETMKNLNY